MTPTMKKSAIGGYVIIEYSSNDLLDSQGSPTGICLFNRSKRIIGVAVAPA
jgi:hypothetical protein